MNLWQKSVMKKQAVKAEDLMMRWKNQNMMKLKKNMPVIHYIQATD